MFKWLTRNDGAKKSRLKRRLKSPRGSVFSEFAIVMPIVLLMCSAIFEVIGFWDAQIMANHSAWQVGRIASVRGDDGMAFSETVTKMSKTGVISEKMPEPIKKLLQPLLMSIGGALEKFNDRGVITTMFLMSTCEIGYYGGSPGTELAEKVDKLISDAIDGIVKGLPDCVNELIKEKIDWIPDGDGVIGKLVSDLVKKIVEVAIRPILEAIGKAIAEAVKKFLELIDIDKLFSGGSAAARRARQIYGAAVRVAKANEPVSSVTELKDKIYVFAKNTSASQGRLAYPLVADKEVKSDGYFVTGAHGWPPNDQALKLLKVEIKWPYSRGWIFPVVSGYGKTSAPVARGTSIAFPQPNIVDKNLWSTGAVAYVDGDYTNKMSNAYEEVAKAMKKYLAIAQFGMKYRLSKEVLKLVDEDPNPLHSWTPKHCEPLLDLFEANKGGDYATCWDKITGGQKQTALMVDLEPYFNESVYRKSEYFYWEESWHKRYDSGMVGCRGAVGFGIWSAGNPPYTADSGCNGRGCVSIVDFLVICGEYADQIKEAKLQFEDVYNAYSRFNGCLRGFRLADVVQWKDPGNYRSWYSRDHEAQSASIDKADKRFGKIIDLLNAEIKDIQNILDDKMDEYKGDDGDDFIIDPDDQKAIDDPEKAAAEAMKKWEARKKELKLLLQDIDQKIVVLNNAWANYRTSAFDLMNSRGEFMDKGMARVCLRVCIATRSVDILKNGNVASFADVLRGKALVGYDIVGKTFEFAALQDEYCNALEASWNAEVEYGTKLGLASAKKAKKSGKSIDELDFDEDIYPDGEGGTLSPGSDSGWPIDRDHETWSKTGGWK